MTGTLTEAYRGFPAEHATRHRMRPGCRESLAHMLASREHGIAGFEYPSVQSQSRRRRRT